MTDHYLESIRQQFAFYRKLGDRTVAQMDEKELFWQYRENSNSIAILIQHISGNLISRFTDFLSTDGEKESRDRDAEFEIALKTREDLIAIWESCWECTSATLDSLQPEDLEKIIYIRNEGHTVIEALNRALAHTAYHVGQIVHTGVMLRGDEWKTLSVARGESKTRNDAMFSKPKTHISPAKTPSNKD
jgi:hypothetical protein